MKNLLKLNVVGFSEIDKPAIKAYCAIHGVNENKNLGDITKINLDAIDKNVTLVTLGSPCQSFSSSGKLQGSKWSCKKCGHSFDPLSMESAFNDYCPNCGCDDLDKSQSSLLAHGLDVVRHVKAPVVIFENVKNLTSKKFESTFKLLIKKIEDCGYNVYYQVLNAKDFALQNRERVYMVAIRKDIDTGAFKFPTPVSKGLSINDLLEHDQELIDYEDSVIIDSKIAPYLKPHIEEELPQILKSTKGIYRLHLKSGFNDGGIGINYVPALRASNSSTLVLHKIETPSGMKTKVHKLTPLEAYRFMGFSDEDYTKACNAGCKRTQIYKQAGNSIVVDVIYHIAKELFKAIPKLSENDQIGILSLFSGIGAFEKAFERVIKESNDELLESSQLLGELKVPLWTERLYQHKELGMYFFETKLHTGDTDVIKISKGEAIGWLAENYADFPFKDVFGITFGVGVDSRIKGEDFFDEYTPKTQLWNDVIETFYTACDEVYADLKEDRISSDYEWFMNDFQPIRRITTESGDEYEVYVYTSEE